MEIHGDNGRSVRWMARVKILLRRACACTRGWATRSPFCSFFVVPVGLCRTCARGTGPRSTVTAFLLTSPCLSLISSSPPLSRFRWLHPPPSLSLHPPSFLLFSPFDSSLSPPFPSLSLSLTPLPLLFHQTTFLVAFIHPFVILTLSLFIDLPSFSSTLLLSLALASPLPLSFFSFQRTSRTKGVGVPKRRCTSSGTGDPHRGLLFYPQLHAVLKPHRSPFTRTWDSCNVHRGPRVLARLAPAIRHCFASRMDACREPSCLLSVSSTFHVEQSLSLTVSRERRTYGVRLRGREGVLFWMGLRFRKVEFEVEHEIIIRIKNGLKMLVNLFINRSRYFSNN